MLKVVPGLARVSYRQKSQTPTHSASPLLWFSGDHHLGFVRMAVRHGYTIVPIVTVGTEEPIAGCVTGEKRAPFFMELVPLAWVALKGN